MLEKIKTLGQLKQIASEARAKGRKVVLAHGVFDILHVGHKRHLDIGKRHGDVLIVTLTTDKFVNKGPDRPVFAEKLRAEMVAGLESVDYVGISPNPGAEHVIETVRPNFYLKGSEYSDEEGDVTGRIKTERLTVEKFGGEVLYTEDITFSSSNLSNRVLQLYPEDAAAFLKDLRTRITAADLIKEVAAVQSMRCLIIGDTILDEYIYVEPLGKPAKENIIATKYRDREIFCGGAIATANLAAQIVRQRRSRDAARTGRQPRGLRPRQSPPEHQAGAVLSQGRPDDGEEPAGRSRLCQETHRDRLPVR